MVNENPTNHHSSNEIVDLSRATIVSVTATRLSWVPENGFQLHRMCWIILPANVRRLSVAMSILQVNDLPACLSMQVNTNCMV